MAMLNNQRVSQTTMSWLTVLSVLSVLGILGVLTFEVSASVFCMLIGSALNDLYFSCWGYQNSALSRKKQEISCTHPKPPVIWTRGEQTQDYMPNNHFMCSHHVAKIGTQYNSKDTFRKDWRVPRNHGPSRREEAYHFLDDQCNSSPQKEKSTPACIWRFPKISLPLKHSF